MTAPVLTRLIGDFAARRALRAGSFIVTFYGDVILPRGRSVWIGNVIEACRVVGINESQSRTAISRLVEAGRLTSRRLGRRSFYQLTDWAAAEFRAAADAIYGPACAPPGDPWTFVHLDAEAADALGPLSGRGFAPMGGGLVVKPGDCRAEVRALLGGGRRAVVVAGVPEPLGEGALADWASTLWDLATLSADYAAFADRFGPLAAALADGHALGGAESVVARLLLVHDFRRIALRDPRLPPGAVPADWAGDAARVLFRACYDRLTPVAEHHVLSHFRDAA